MRLSEITRTLSPRRRLSTRLAAIAFLVGCSFGSILGLAEAQLLPDPMPSVPPLEEPNSEPKERRGYLWDCERAKLLTFGECSPPAAGSQRCLENLERMLTLCSQEQLCGRSGNTLETNWLEHLRERACGTVLLRTQNQQFCLSLDIAIVLWCGISDPQAIPGSNTLERNGTFERARE